MFFTNFLCVFAVFSVVSTSPDRYSGRRYSKSEIPCLTHGGLCVKASDCPAEQRSAVKGLCPSFQNEGYECCHGVGISETRCGKNGGLCVSKEQRCPLSLLVSKATDCADNQKCCVLV